MLVVADASPINVLVRIRRIELLGTIFESVLVPPEVIGELSDPQTPRDVQAFVKSPPAWLSIRSVQSPVRIPSLDPGEEAAINLAREVRAQAVLIDEKAARRAARGLGFTVIGTIGILEIAAKLRLLSFPEALDDLAKTDFRMGSKLMNEALRRNRAIDPES